MRPRHSSARNLRRTAARHLGRFARAEDGNLFILAVPLILIMAIWGGISVDLMRYESRRAMLQGVTDRSVLAAANLNQSQDPKAVVRDYFTKAGMADQLVGDAIVTQGYKRREVSVKGDFKMDTFFMRYLGEEFETLDAPATSTAVQGVGAVEVSLVLDVSGSMDFNINNTYTKRIEKLRSAASGFVTKLLLPEYKDRISISLIPYSEQVNIGPEIFNLLKINPGTKHNFSHCIELPASAFTKTTFDDSLYYEQTQNIQTNAYGFGRYTSTRDKNNPNLDQPVCPRFDYERVIPISQNATQLTTAISKLQPRAGTSIFLGLKWATTLLDPSFQSVIKRLPASTIDTPFDERPEPYDPDKSKGQTIRSLKYIVLMTDGFNQNSYRLYNEHYDDPSERLYWAYHNVPWVTNSEGNATGPRAPQSRFYNDKNYFYTGTQGAGYMDSMCDAAKNKGIIIYTISMSGDDNDQDDIDGRAAMEKCATSKNHFFKTSGQELNEIFDRIAKQITDLRLTQ